MNIPKEIIADMIAHARECAPIEACGLLAGAEGRVARSYRLTNVDKSREHYSLDPKEQFAVVKGARALGLEILAVYHSHPETPARMSEEDLRLAVAPGIEHVIVSLAGESGPNIRSFRVVDGKPMEQEISEVE